MAIGTGAKALAKNAISIGTGNVVSGENSGAIGDPSIIDGANSYSVGNNNAIGAASQNVFVLGNDVKIGANGTTDASGTVALGNNNNISSKNTFVMGNGVVVPAGLDGAVVLGNLSATAAAVPTKNFTTSAGVVTGDFAGATPAAGDIVSVGKADAPRQIKHVAAGRIASDSQDAINGSQLYAGLAATQTHFYSVNSLPTDTENYNNDGAKAAHALAAGVSALAEGESATAVGHKANAGAINSTAIGHNAKVISGPQAGKGYAGTAVGFDSLAREGDVAIGTGALQGYDTTKDTTVPDTNKTGYNTAVGLNAGQNSIGTINVFIGQSSGNAQEGDRNMYLGAQAGANALGNDNTTLGAASGANLSSLASLSAATDLVVITTCILAAHLVSLRVVI